MPTAAGVQVLDYELQKQLVPYMKAMKPLPGIYDPKFIAANQAERADHTIPGSRKEQMEAVRGHIRAFKEQHGLDKIIVLWTGNTERYAEVRAGLNDSKGVPVKCTLHCRHGIFSANKSTIECVTMTHSVTTAVQCVEAM